MVATDRRATASVRRKPSRLEEALLWYHFVPVSCPEGRDWYAEYQQCGGEALGQRIDVSVALMRRRQIDAGKALLDECRACFAASAAGMPRAIAGIVEEG